MRVSGNLKETEMDHEGITKSKPGNLMEEGLREDMDQRQGAPHNGAKRITRLKSRYEYGNALFRIPWAQLGPLVSDEVKDSGTRPYERAD